MVGSLKQSRKNNFAVSSGGKRYVFGFNSMAYVIISNTQNNWILTLTDLHGDIICVVSSGCVGMDTPSMKRSFWAADKLGSMLGMRVFDLDINLVYMVFKVPITGHIEAILQGLVSSGVSVLGFNNSYCLAHNGCRKSNMRSV